MQFFPWLKQLLTVDDSILNDRFTLTPADSAQQQNSAAPDGTGKQDEGTAKDPSHASNSKDGTSPQEAQAASPDGDESKSQEQGHLGRRTGVETWSSSAEEGEIQSRRPIPMKELVHQAEQKRDAQESTGESAVENSNLVPKHIEEVKEKLKDTFHLPQNKDIVVREFFVGTERQWKAMAVFVDGMADKNTINSHILEPLMLLAHLSDETESSRIETVEKTLLPGNQLEKNEKWSDMVQGILSGSTGVFIDGVSQGMVVETKGWEHRTVGLAQTEPVVRGPHDAFTESFRANTGLLRSRLRSEHLVTEMIPIGRLGRTDVAVMYIDGLTNKSLVDEVKRRLKAIDVDFAADSGLIEQFIEDSPATWIPQIMSTERPDRVAHMLAEGHVAIFVGNSPFALTVPVVLWSLVQTSEDAYIKFPFGTFLRFLRWSAMFTAVLLPAFYIAVSNYHPEMIPTDLLLAIAGSREQVPFPAIVEVLLMEFSIELIREAGIRIPSIIGPTIGIVGALIIGQAAVQAGIVSPLLVIVIAVTALASFTIPNYNLSFAVRVGRFLFLFAAAMFGFYGIALMLIVLGAKLAVHKSFGVPFLSPVVPSSDSSPDVFIRGPSYQMNQRPAYMMTQTAWRQQPYTRPWSKTSQSRPGFLQRRKRGKS